jgi:hypothetical protein
MYLPNSQQLYDEIVWELAIQQLGQDGDVRNKGRLKHDGHVRGVKELDRVSSLLATEFAGLDRYLNPKSLEVDDNQEGDKS